LETINKVARELFKSFNQNAYNVIMKLSKLSDTESPNCTSLNIVLEKYSVSAEYIIL